MKPAAFDYHAPSTVEEALSLLAEYGDESKPLAGGQSLIPTMNFRLAQPAVLVDLNGIDGLVGIDATADGVRIGAMTRQRDVERSAVVAERAPLVTEALPFVAHPQIRNRGTFGGNLAHAEPGSELPAVVRALGARMVVRSVRGERRIDADDFYTGLFETALEPDELLVAVELPSPTARTGHGFEEFSRRHGDYALAGAAVTVTLDGTGRVEAARIGLFSVGPGPMRATTAEAALEGHEPTAEALAHCAGLAAEEDIEPSTDIHASEAYRRHLTRVLTTRVLGHAVERAGR